MNPNFLKLSHGLKLKRFQEQNVKCIYKLPQHSLFFQYRSLFKTTLSTSLLIFKTMLEEFETKSWKSTELSTPSMRIMAHTISSKIQHSLLRAIRETTELLWVSNHSKLKDFATRSEFIKSSAKLQEFNLKAANRSHHHSIWLRALSFLSNSNEKI